MSRRVATITLNPAYDLVGACPEIERGEVNLVKTVGLHAAGKGINVARVLKDLGIDVTVGGFLGKDNQDGFQLLFSELGIANRFQVVPGRTRINVKLTEKKGEVTDFNFSGFEVTKADWDRFVNESLSWLGQFDMVAVSGSLPSGVNPDDFTDWMRRLRSQSPCIIFDSSREALVAGLKASPWLVKPNRRELEIWAGRPLPELCDVVEAAHALRDPEGFLTQAIAQAKPYQAVAPAATVTLATGPKRIVAITACPTGVAHTFMAAEAIESEAKKRGWWVKVETRGSVGEGNQY